MNESPEQLINLYLLKRASMTPEQIEALSQWVTAAPENAEIFLSETILHQRIQAHFVTRNKAQRDTILDLAYNGDSAGLDRELWRLVSMERNAPAIPPKKKSAEPEKKEPSKPTLSQPVKPTVWIAITFGSIAAVLVLVFMAILSPKPLKPVATISDLQDVRWIDLEELLPIGSRLLDNAQPFTLARGLAEIQFENNATLVIEGPATFRVEHENRLYLSYGKLSARIPPEALGFRVDTPTCGVVDLGTEFGIRVHRDGIADVRMFKGKSALYPVYDKNEKAKQEIIGGQSRTVDTSGAIQKIELPTGTFIRQFSSQNGIRWSGEPINLADIVGGGHGFGSGHKGWGIDYSSGTLDRDPLPNLDNVVSTKFTPIPASPYIDGVFVTKGNRLQLSSLGHETSKLPRAQTEFVTGILNAPPELLEGAVEQASAHSAIYMHTNEGITFDLRAIRALLQSLHKEMTITQFNTSFTMTQITEETRQQRPTIPPANLRMAGIWILIDGQLRLYREEISEVMGPVPIQVPLKSKDKFLTIIVSEAKSGPRTDDWTLLIDPLLQVSY